MALSVRVYAQYCAQAWAWQYCEKEPSKSFPLLESLTFSTFSWFTLASQFSRRTCMMCSSASLKWVLLSGFHVSYGGAEVQDHCGCWILQDYSDRREMKKNHRWTIFAGWGINIYLVCGNTMCVYLPGRVCFLDSCLAIYSTTAE